MCFRSSPWQATACLCSCHYGEAVVCACPPAAGAVTSPVVSSPHAPVVASSHRTDARLRGSSLPIRTPLGLTSRFSSPLS